MPNNFTVALNALMEKEDASPSGFTIDNGWMGGIRDADGGQQHTDLLAISLQAFLDILPGFSPKSRQFEKEELKAEQEEPWDRAALHGVFTPKFGTILEWSGIQNWCWSGVEFFTPNFGLECGNILKGQMPYFFGNV